MKKSIHPKWIRTPTTNIITLQWQCYLCLLHIFEYTCNIMIMLLELFDRTRHFKLVYRRGIETITNERTNEKNGLNVLFVYIFDTFTYNISITPHAVCGICMSMPSISNTWKPNESVKYTWTCCLYLLLWWYCWRWLLVFFPICMSISVRLVYLMRLQFQWIWFLIKFVSVAMLLGHCWCLNIVDLVCFFVLFQLTVFCSIHTRSNMTTSVSY